MDKWRRHTNSRWVSGTAVAGEFPIVEVLWWDALAKAVDNWESDIDNAPITVATVGYLVGEDEHAVTVASLISETAVGHAITIPVGCIKEMRQYVGK